MDRFTLLDGSRVLDVEARVDGDRVWISAGALREGLGWTVEERGLCRGGLCVPFRDRSRTLKGDTLDLEEVARLLDRPLALDVPERCAALGASAVERTDSLRSLRAPGFRLPDLSGREHTLSEHRGRKILLVAWASW